MKCPLSITGVVTRNTEFFGAAADCLKEQCGWWDGHSGCCCILKVTRLLEAISLSNAEIANKMPGKE